jgi:phage antirepressor YoqD-like protein
MPKDDEDAEVIFRKLPASLTQELALAQLNGNKYLLQKKRKPKLKRKRKPKPEPYDETTLWVKISKDLCDLLGISTHTLRQWVSDEKVISRFEGGRRLVHYNDLKRKVARE